MITRSTFLHLRLPFSWFLLPVYLLALLSAEHIEPVKAWIVFAVLHFLLYPAANGFNSFYDRDKGSIGVLRCPPPVTADLVRVSLALDVAAIVVACFVGWVFAMGCFLYGLGSKAYSWEGLRLKRYPVLSWLMTGLGQGLFVFLLVVLSVQGDHLIAPGSSKVFIPALVSSLFVLGFFPLTQVYQHREDAERGCETISLRLGIRGTFLVVLMFTLASSMLYYMHVAACYGVDCARLFVAMTLPSAAWFAYGLVRVMKDEATADFRYVMQMCYLSASGVNLFLLAMLARA